MFNNQNESSHTGAPIVLLVFINAIILKEGLVSSPGLNWLLCLTVPLLLITAIRSRRRRTKNS